jgi:hypothetical protein
MVPFSLVTRSLIKLGFKKFPANQIFYAIGCNFGIANRQVDYISADIIVSHAGKVGDQYVSFHTCSSCYGGFWSLPAEITKSAAIC